VIYAAKVGDHVELLDHGGLGLLGDHRG
jgi:hypothetical protein